MQINLPEVTGPIAWTPTSRPWNASGLEPQAYELREYLLHGDAHEYTWPRIDELHVVGRTRYTTRLIVRRPSPVTFSGTVCVELMNPTFGCDLPFMWGGLREALARRGDAYVGLTVKPAAMAALKRFECERYEPLSMTDAGLAWDIVSDLAAVLRADVPGSPLAGYPIKRLILTGYSQAGAYVGTYMSARARPIQLETGKRLFDAYFPVAGSYLGVPINQRADVPPPGDPRARFRPPPGVPLVVLTTQTDFASAAMMARPTHRPQDMDGTHRVRLYEVPGATHLTADLVEGAFPAQADLERLGAVLVATWDPRDPLNPFPLRRVLAGAWSNLDRWAADGTPPPYAERLQADVSHWPPTVVKHENTANPVGGLQTPWTLVPTATYHERSGVRHLEQAAGYAVLFTPQQLRDAYGSHDAYVERVRGAVTAAVSDRWLTAEDGQRTIAEAEQVQFE